jgi:hypothetical protein
MLTNEVACPIQITFTLSFVSWSQNAFISSSVILCKGSVLLNVFDESNQFINHWIRDFLLALISNLASYLFIRQIR